MVVIPEIRSRRARAREQRRVISTASTGSIAGKLATVLARVGRKRTNSRETETAVIKARSQEKPGPGVELDSFYPSHCDHGSG
jgi:hypothetical protein